MITLLSAAEKSNKILNDQLHLATWKSLVNLIEYHISSFLKHVKTYFNICEIGKVYNRWEVTISLAAFFFLSILCKIVVYLIIYGILGFDEM